MYYSPEEDESVVESVDEENLIKAREEMMGKDERKDIDSTRRII